MHDTFISILKEVGRGKDGSRPMTREQAASAWGLLLDGQASDVQLGAFCMAMRFKGETAEEMAGFLDATHARMQAPALPDPARFTIVLPSYNGARRLPLLTPLLAGLLQQAGLQVLLHGMATEDRRVATPALLTELASLGIVLPAWHETASLCPGLVRVLNVRRSIGLRNSAHSLVKLMNPLHGTALQARSLVVGSYTHPEYAESMAATVELLEGNALLLRGTEGEPVADARRQPLLRGFVRGQQVMAVEAQYGSLADLPDLPHGTDGAACARYTAEVLTGRLPVPTPIVRQVECLLELARQAGA